MVNDSPHEQFFSFKIILNAVITAPTTNVQSAHMSPKCSVLKFTLSIVLVVYYFMKILVVVYGRRQFQKTISEKNKIRERISLVVVIWFVSLFTAVCSSPFKPMSEDHWWWKLFYDCDNSTCGAMLQTHWNVAINKIRNKERSTEKLFQ